MAAKDNSGKKYCLIESLNEEDETKFRRAIEAQLALSIEGCDQVLSEYIIVMLKNRKTAAEVRLALSDLVGDNVANDFEKWLLGRKELGGEVQTNLEPERTSVLQQTDDKSKVGLLASKGKKSVPKASEEKKISATSQRQEMSTSKTFPVQDSKPEKEHSRLRVKLVKEIDTASRIRGGDFSGSRVLLSSALKQSVTSIKDKGTKFPKVEQDKHILQSDFVTRKNMSSTSNVVKRTSTEAAYKSYPEECKQQTIEIISDASFAEPPRKKYILAGSKKQAPPVVSHEVSDTNKKESPKKEQNASTVYTHDNASKSEENVVEAKPVPIYSFADLFKHPDYLNIVKSLPKVPPNWSTPQFGRGLPPYGGRLGRALPRGRTGGQSMGRPPFKNASWRAPVASTESIITPNTLSSVPSMQVAKLMGAELTSKRVEDFSGAVSFRGRARGGRGRMQSGRSAGGRVPQNLTWNRKVALEKSLNTPR